MLNPFGQHTPLTARFRKWWYGNVAEPFTVEGQQITRQEAHTHGGPNPQLNGCRTCQIQEWLSRVRHKNLFKPHNCKIGQTCKVHCQKQTSELWSNYHQNFWFALGCTPKLNAPRGLVLFPNPSKPRLRKRYFTHCCDQWAIVLRRQFAYTGMVDVVPTLQGIEWKRYDYMFFQNCMGMPTFKKPPIPLIMYGHDLWKGELQTPILGLRPEILLTPYVSAWKRKFAIPKHTKVRFYPLSPSQFLTRPNLGAKKIDLLSIGTLGSGIYAPRRELHGQIKALAKSYKRFKIVTSHSAGYVRNDTEGPVVQGKPGKYTVRYLNAWSKFLGSAKYVIFGGCSPPAHDWVLMKYCEVLGSGAVPIIPEVADLRFLGVKPLVHYIPLSMVWKNNGALIHFLDNYPLYQYIAINAATWHQENADRMMLNGFENLVHEITGGKYPKRVV